MRNYVKLAAFLAAGLVSAEAAAQTPQWYGIACAHSKIVASGIQQCRTTQNYAGGATAYSATFRSWVSAGNSGGSGYFYALNEATSPGASVGQNTTLQDTIRAEMAGGAQANGFSALSNRGGADYMTFTSGGDSCIGIRRYGPSQGVGYQWILYGVRCDPKGRTVSDAEINQFIAGATVRGS